MEENKQERPLEEIFAELDGILKKMQNPEVSLEESFSLYEQGMRDIRQSTGLLDEIEQKMLLLSKEGETVPFDGEEAP